MSAGLSEKKGIVKNCQCFVNSKKSILDRNKQKYTCTFIRMRKNFAFSFHNLLMQNLQRGNRASEAGKIRKDLLGIEKGSNSQNVLVIL